MALPANRSVALSARTHQLAWEITRFPPYAVRRQAAEAGDAHAMAHLGHMYASGAGVVASNATALEWFRQAAEKNQASALYGLGYMHLSGRGVPRDARKAFKYFTLAAEQVRLPLPEATSCCKHGRCTAEEKT